MATGHDISLIQPAGTFVCCSACRCFLIKPIPFSFTNRFYLPYGRRTGGYAGSCQPGRGNIYIIFYSDLGERAVRYGFERRAFYVMSRRIRDGLAASLFHNNEVGDGTSFINLNSATL